MKISLLTQLGCLIVCTSVLLTQVQAKDLELLDRVAIIVNDDAILASDIRERMADIKIQIGLRNGTAPPDEVLLRQLVDRMINESIQDQMAQKFQIKVQDKAINSAMNRIVKEQQMDLQAYKQQIKANDLPANIFRDQIEKQLIHFQLQQKALGQRVQVSEKDIQNFLESQTFADNNQTEYKLRHILLSLNERASPEAVQQKTKLAEALVDAIRDQEVTFESAAIANSSDRYALNGGDLGWRKISQIPSRFITSLKTLEPGGVTDPIRSPSGLHILQLEEKRGEKTYLIEQANIQHILIKPNQIRSDENAQAFAADLRQKIKDGRPFAELATTFSDDPGSALSGGKLGWTNLDELDPKFRQVAEDIKLNTLSPVFQSSFGYHILQVTGRRKEDFSEAKKLSQAKQYLQQRAFEEQLPLWLSEIRGEAFVDFKPPFDELFPKPDESE